MGYFHSTKSLTLQAGFAVRDKEGGGGARIIVAHKSCPGLSAFLGFLSDAAAAAANLGRQADDAGADRLQASFLRTWS